MASPPSFDIETLCKPISDKQPAGLFLPYTNDADYMALKTAWRASRPPAMAIAGMTRPTVDWAAVVHKGTIILATKSKDLQVWAWRNVGLVHQEGFNALADDFDFGRELLTRFWEHLHPRGMQPEATRTYRANPLLWLNDELPAAISMVPLTCDPSGNNYSYWQLQATDSSQQRSPETGASWYRAVCATPAIFYDTCYNALARCIDAHRRLTQAIETHFGIGAPRLSAIHEALQCCVQCVETLRKTKNSGSWMACTYSKLVKHIWSPGTPKSSVHETAQE